MIHVNRGDAPHEFLTDEDLKEKYPDLHAQIHRPRPYASEGKRLKDARKAASLTLHEVSKRLGWPITKVSDAEQGVIELTLGETIAYSVVVGR